MNVPSSRFQVPEKFQESNSKSLAGLFLELEDWSFSGAWNLELGTWNFFS
jgi:hypothetical protein